MSEANLVRCKKCGKPVGYITVYGKTLMGNQQPIQNVKVEAVCLNCKQKKFTVP